MKRSELKPAVGLNRLLFYKGIMEDGQLILEKLEKIEREVVEIKEHMIDVDTILTAEERIMINDSLKHEKEGKLVSLEDIENVRNKAR